MTARRAALLAIAATLPLRLAAAEAEAEGAQGACAALGPGSCGDSALSAAAALPPAEPKADGGYPRYAAVPKRPGARVWTAEELALHDGRDTARPLLLAIVGEVFDVGPGSKHYAPGKGYSTFAGHDRGRAFADMSDEGDDESLSKVEDLSSEDFQGVLGWRSFYRDHETYRFVGFARGRYFDAGGPTDEHGRVEALHAKKSKVEDYKKDLQKRFMSCNSRHSAADSFFEIWCDDSYHPKGSVPLHLYFSESGARGDSKEAGWCACLPPSARDTAEKDAAASGKRFRLVDYPECQGDGGAPPAQRCRRHKGAKPP